MHVITGLPRSGSTLLCNLLNQRADVFASSTSALYQVVTGISQVFTDSPEETSRLANIPGTQQHHVNILRGVMEGWHDTTMPVVFDKGRGWSQGGVLLRAIWPSAAMIVTVRDPRDVLASIERQHQKTGQYGPGGTLWERASMQMSEEGIVGSCIMGVEDLIRRNFEGVKYLDYTAISLAPDRAMIAIEEVVNLEPFDYDFDNVESTATDADEVYRHKFPHDASGAIEDRGQNWRDVLPAEIAQLALERWPLYTRTFGYS